MALQKGVRYVDSVYDYLSVYGVSVAKTVKNMPLALNLLFNYRCYNIPACWESFP